MEIARNWRLQKQRYNLVGRVCTDCGNIILPLRAVCPECEAPARTPFQFSGRGEVYSFSIVHRPPTARFTNVYTDQIGVNRINFVENSR